MKYYVEWLSCFIETEREEEEDSLSVLQRTLDMRFLEEQYSSSHVIHHVPRMHRGLLLLKNIRCEKQE